jgi:predicted AlkP superfamily pyrophosphatase or phosphodiesterase
MRVTPVRRVVLVVLDGLRPDAIPRFGLEHLSALAARSAFTMRARTVRPSVTACAMASLLTGAAPERHGLQSDRFHLPRRSGPLHPLPQLLAEHQLPTSAHLAAMPLLFGGIAQRIAARLGITQSRFRGRGCTEIEAGARTALREQRRGLIFQHWPDADRAGHAHGWMSDAYARAALEMDVALGALVRQLDLDDPSTLFIALADHGGGGAVPDHHDSTHPLDTTIPLFLAGGAVRRGELPAGLSLLDVPATVCWALGLQMPESYAGQPLTMALETSALVAAA